MLPAVVILRSADDLPTVGHHFNPEIVSDLGACTLRTGLVEIISQDQAPSRSTQE